MIDIRKCTADLIEHDFDLSTPVTETMFDYGLINERNARRVLIQDDYLRYTRYRRKTDIKIYLVERYRLTRP